RSGSAPMGMALPVAAMPEPGIVSTRGPCQFGAVAVTVGGWRTAGGGRPGWHGGGVGRSGAAPPLEFEREPDPRRLARWQVNRRWRRRVAGRGIRTHPAKLHGRMADQ